MLSAAKTLLSLKVAEQKVYKSVPKQGAPKRKAAIVARQLIRLCAESEQD
jgi:hypothetical protein